MPRKKHKTELTPENPESPDVFDEVIAEREAEQQPTESHDNEVELVLDGEAAAEPESNGHEESGKKWAKGPNPRGFEMHKGKGNRVRLLKSEPESRYENGAWVIRFDSSPNEMEGYNGKDNPHPVIKMLKDEGFRWGFDRDGKGGWGKEWGMDPYGEDHADARRVLSQAAEMIGAPKEQSISM